MNWDVFVTPGIPTVTSDLPPGTRQQMWQPISSTLIYGKRDAILVDAFVTVEQAGALVDWVAASGKNLTSRLPARAQGHRDWIPRHSIPSSEPRVDSPRFKPRLVRG